MAFHQDLHCFLKRKNQSSRIEAHLGNPRYTIKSLLEAHALIEGHSPVWTPKMPIFQANFQKNQASNKGQPRNIEEEKKRSYFIQKHLQFVISSEFLVIRLQQTVLKKGNLFLTILSFCPEIPTLTSKL